MQKQCIYLIFCLKNEGPSIFLQIEKKTKQVASVLFVKKKGKEQTEGL